MKTLPPLCRDSSTQARKVTAYPLGFNSAGTAHAPLSDGSPQLHDMVETPRTSTDGSTDNLVGSGAVPLLLQLGLSGAIKIFGPVAPQAESGPQHRVAFDLYAVAVLLTFAFDVLLAINVVAFGVRFAAYNKPLAAVITKALISVALAVSFSAAVIGTVLNILV